VAAYVIGNVEVENPEAYAEYTARVPASIAEFGGHFIVRGGATEVKEGKLDAGRVVVIEFPDMDAARAWYASATYQQILPIRLANSHAAFIAIVDGVTSPVG
jgi:uncharacterized protein (DUF1330 family)